MPILFGATIFLGALLLFLLQPMVGRMLLPLLGGAPAVWNTSMVFFQTLLLAGYAYAHFSSRWLGVRRQAALHAILLMLPVLVLPIAIPYGWRPPTAHNPTPWLLMLLTAAVGLPFFVVSATSPLLQRWFSTTTHRDAGDPYFLYAASNFGSLLALLCYPALIEPRLRLSQQSQWWAVGYGALVVLMAICGVMAWRTARERVTGAEVLAAVSSERPTPRRRWRWLLLAFVPCSQMLSVTTYITTEVAPMPLLWVIPLGIYLLSFVLVFAKRRVVPHRWIIGALPFAVLLSVMLLARKVLLSESFLALGWPMTLHLLALFVVAMFCHGELAADRPTVSRLTEFYLWISAGGVLGGIFNALLAPLIFHTVIEYPITLLLACLLMPSRTPDQPNRRTRMLDVVLPVLLGLFTAGFLWIFMRDPLRSPEPIVAYGLPSMICLSFWRRPLRFALGVLALLVATTLGLRPDLQTIVVVRSFFGIHRVELFPWQQNVHFLRHGSTIHGMQDLNPAERRTPLMYFAKSGPLGQTIATLPAELRQRVAVIGLGAGTVACYAETGQQWTFYEIDPEVKRIASDPQYFTYLQDCPANVHVVLGDGRLSLQAAADGEFGLMILDAYNSDTVPLHLVTREALQLYLRKLMPSGVLAFNISNRNFDLEPVFANLAQNASVFALCRFDRVTTEESQGTGKVESCWVVMTRDAQRLKVLAEDSRWQPPRVQPEVGIWTDDYASLFRVFIWR